jgi:hypothetical protein
MQTTTQRKLLDHTALNFIRQQRAKYFTYDAIRLGLMQLGYTSKRGGELHVSDVSQFACKNGLRTNKPRTSKRQPVVHLAPTQYSKVGPVPVLPQQTKPQTLTGVQAFMSSVVSSGDLSNTQKVKVLTALLEGQA